MHKFGLVCALVGTMIVVRPDSAFGADFSALSWESAGGASASAPSVPVEEATPQWPATREGQLARGWVEAFSAGETSMQTFVEFNLAPEKLASRSMEERMASYRKLHKTLGALRLVEVTQAQAGELSVVLASSEKDERHETVFRVQLEEPRKLLGVELAMRQSHGLFGH